MSGCFKEDGGGSLPVSVMGTTCDPTGTGRAQGRKRKGLDGGCRPFSASMLPLGDVPKQTPPLLSCPLRILVPVKTQARVDPVSVTLVLQTGIL